MKREFNYLEIHIVDHCNLNCARCSHYSPIAKPRFYDLTQFEAELKQIAIIKEKDIKPFLLRIMGGEPLLHPQVLDFCKIARRILPQAEIWIVSNGLNLINKEEYFFKTLNDNGIGFQLTLYPRSKNDNSIILNKVIKINKHQIVKREQFKSIDLDFSTEQEFALKCGNPQMICTILKDNYLYRCAMEAYNFNLKEQFNVVFPKTYDINANRLNIYNCTEADILNFINTPSTFCKYCNWNKNLYEGWIPSTKNKKEWILKEVSNET